MEYSKDWEETGTNPGKVKAKYKKNKEKIAHLVKDLAISIFKYGQSPRMADICLSYKHPLFKYSITHCDVTWLKPPLVAIIRIYTAPALGAVQDRDIVLLDTLTVKFKNGE
jgi:hypothetical protein